jgi:hypothetical protein
VCLPNDETADGDGDGTRDCEDGCPDDDPKTAPGVCGCEEADDDSDGDGIIDCEDRCLANPATSCAPTFYISVTTPTGPGQVACTWAAGVVTCAQADGLARVTPTNDLTSCE